MTSYTLSNSSLHNINIQISKSGDKVPFIGTYQLHSIYDPIKEAQLNLEQNKENIQAKEKILILGLGFGYHVNAIINYLKEIGSEKSILVIEPNEYLHKIFLDNFGVPNFEILSGKSPSELYLKNKFISVISCSPMIFKHQQTFNLYPTYFSEIFSHKPTNSVKEAIEIFETFTKNNDLELINFLKQLHPQTHFMEALNSGENNQLTLYKRGIAELARTVSGGKI